MKDYEAIINFAKGEIYRENKEFDTAADALAWLNEKLKETKRVPRDPRLYVKYIANRDMHILFDKETNTVTLRPEEDVESPDEDEYWRGE